ASAKICYPGQISFRLIAENHCKNMPLVGAVVFFCCTHYGAFTDHIAYDAVPRSIVLVPTELMNVNLRSVSASGLEVSINNV
ncbi:hypothetical protein, partial [Clostridium sp. E02]|uniref:hypothetical protein n=1 Tax=Clostridium sp. E02 TaxID=2487134 RepID=UPI0019D263A2